MEMLSKERLDLLNEKQIVKGAHDLVVHSMKQELIAATGECTSLKACKKMTNDKSAEVSLQIEAANAETYRIRSIGESLERQHAGLQSEIDRLRKQDSSHDAGTQKLKVAMEEIINEQRAAHTTAAFYHGQEANRLTERICCLEDQLNQQPVSGPMRREQC